MRARRTAIEAFCAHCKRAIAEGEEYVRDSYREYFTPYGMQTWYVILCGSCRDDPLSWELARLRADLALRDLGASHG